jgi:DNA/RNA-binding domain of Phe-tRNA-synthetase-like protein
MTTFQYDAQIIANYPQLVGGVIIADGLSNPPTPTALREQYAAEQAAVKARIVDTPLSEIESISAWRSAISAFGVSPTKYRSAAEALLRRLTKKGDIPGINTLVDIGNLVSIRYALPVAIFDTRQIDAPITVKYADGTETFTDLGSDEAVHPEVGEVIFADEKNMAVARRWCWRQSATSASSEHTTQAVITVEAHHRGARSDIERAVADLTELLQTYAGGSFSSAILTAEQPGI